MPTHHLPLPPIQPINFFDPFYSSTTGHQRPENRMSGSTSWRESRTYKLAHQFKDGSGCGGTQHLSDLVEMETENIGKVGRKGNGDREQAAPDLREEGWQDIRNLIKGTKKGKSKCFSAEDKSSVPIMPQTDVDVGDLVARTGIAPTDLSSSRRPEERR